MATVKSEKGRFLREQRLLRGIPLIRMARWFGIDGPTLYRWETKRQNMPFYVERLYQHYFDTHPQQLSLQEKTS